MLDNKENIFDNADEIDNVIVLNDENGEDIKFEFLDLIEYEGNEYVVLLPVDDEEEAGEVVILLVEESSDDEESYSSVDDEETLMKVFQIFKDKMKDEFNFLDDNC